MRDNSTNKDLINRIKALEDSLSEALKRLSDYESNNLDEFKKLEEQVKSNESEIKNMDKKKISILWERMNNQFDNYKKDQELLFSTNKQLQEMIEASENINSLNNKMLRIEREESNRIQEDKGKEIFRYVDKKLEENKLNLKELISKSLLNSKVEWNNLVHNADFEKLDEILAYYMTNDIPENSNISYHQLKKRLITLLEDTRRKERSDQFVKVSISSEEIENRLTDLNRAYFRKNKRKSRESFIPQEAKSYFQKEKELAKDRQNKLPMKNFSIRLNEDYLIRLKDIADKTGNNRNDLIRDAIDKALERWEDLDDEDLID